MKKTIIISIAIALIAGGCGQAKKKQAETVNNEPAVEKEENNTIINEDKETVLHVIEQVRSENEEWSAEAEYTYAGYELGDGELWYKVIDNKNNLTTNDSIYTSNIRPGEKLLVEEIYTDIFEFFDYNDEGDNIRINVLKDGKMYTLVADELRDIIVSLKKGDLLKIQWTIDFLTPAGDDTIYFVVKFAEKITKIKK